MAQKPEGKKPDVPRPSASVILVSPKNEVLLLHRVKTSSAFPSAHVFPGGNLSNQDGEVPPPEHKLRHDDSDVYRHGALRELFEESGILLAVDDSTGSLIHLSKKDREMGRREIHGEKYHFKTWCKQQRAKPHIEGLTPFTHWVTPTNVPKRFTTQMYLYFLPLPEDNPEVANEYKLDGTAMLPTSDGGKENTAAEFRRASEWLDLARNGDIILFPPQFLLLYLLVPLLDEVQGRYDPHNLPQDLAQRRQQVLEFVQTGDPPWTEKYISPTGITFRKEDGRAVLALDKPGPELKDSNKRGEDKMVVLVKFNKEGPRQVEVAMRDDILGVEKPKL